jgi:cobalt/nickel transport system permease protein
MQGKLEKTLIKSEDFFIMHIPDGFLSLPVWTSLTALSAVTIARAIKKTKLQEDQSQIPLIGVTTAFIFAAQMINFPVAGATSGHLAGGTLAAILFGPWLAMLIMTSVILIQSFFFQDGGITAIGANIFNVGILAPWIGFGIYRCFAKIKTRWIKLCGIFLAAWLSITAAATAVSVELYLSGLIPFHIAAKAMLTWHSIIGIGEGIVTVVILRYFMERRIFLLPTKGALRK